MQKEFHHHHEYVIAKSWMNQQQSTVWICDPLSYLKHPIIPLEELLSAVNVYASTQGYAVVKRRTKKSKKGVLRKAVIMCDRSKVHMDEGRFKRDTSSRKCDCPFDAVATLETGRCVFCIRDASHNHEPTLAGAHPVHRKAAMSQKIKTQIAHQAKAGTLPKQTLSLLRLEQDEENPMFKAHDIYNAGQILRKEALGGFLPIQALFKELTDPSIKWFTSFYPHTGPFKRLFFAKKSSRFILKFNWEVLLIDCTYKTNQYKMPLCIISGVTGLNTSFYIGFVFLSSETVADYIWVLTCLSQLYQELDIPNPNFDATDMEIALINAIQTVFPQASHALCLWHVDKNVLANCKGSFDTDEDWKKFYDDWHKVLFASTKTVFEEKWKFLKTTYGQAHWLAFDYLEHDLLSIWKTRVIKCFTHKLRHFGNTTTLRAEGGHDQLKRSLSCSTGSVNFWHLNVL